MLIPRRLRHRLALALLGLALFSTVMLGAVAVYRLNWELYEQLVRRGQTVARHLADEVFFRAYIQGQRDLVPLAESALGEDVRYVEIVKEGEVLAQAGSLPKKAFLEVWQSILDPSLHRVRRRPGGQAEGPSPLPTPSYVRLAISLDYLGYERGRELLWVGLAGVGIGLVALLAAWGLSGVIVRPLERVTEAMRRFGRGELEVRAPVDQPGELGELAAAFNQMASSIVEMKGQLERASHAKSEFITLMGHELRTPLNVLLGYLELLLEGVGGKLTEEQRSYLQSALHAGEHLQALLGNILGYAKLEMGVERLHLEEIILDEFAKETVEAVRHHAQEKHLKLELAVPKLVLRADRTKLRQILFNLLSNAIRHTPPGGRITLGARRDDDLMLWVRDEGPGIAPEDQARIFEPFVRLEPREGDETEGQREGLGLGLSIVKRYAELHGGRAWVESAPDRGSAFFVSLPLQVPLKQASLPSLEAER